MENPSYYAVIPANVRYDKRLSMSERMLFGEISSLSHASGKCFASNKYFAELYGVSNRTISRWIANLADAGYVKCEIVRSDDNGEIIERYIQLCLNILDDKNVHRGIDKNVHRGIDKNVYYNNTSINKEKKYTKKENEYEDEKSQSIKPPSSKKEKNCAKKEKRFNFRNELLNLGFNEQLVEDWLKVRKDKKASNTETSLNAIISQVHKIRHSGVNINDVMTMHVERSWKGFKFEWFLNETKKTAQVKTSCENLNSYGIKVNQKYFK